MDYLYKYLIQHECLNNKIDDKIIKIVEALDSKLTTKMKIQLVSHYFAFFASQFRKPILFENQLIPINSIAFLFSYSGSGKDTTINKIRSIMRKGISIIDEERDRLNHLRAVELFNQSKDKKAKLENFMLNLPPLEFGLSTPEGLASSIDTNQELNIGSININTNEFIVELASNGNISQMMSSVAEIYDIGFKHSKQLKDKNLQVKTLSNVFLSGLFTSSFNILQDTSTRQKLIIDFKSRFARRSSITFNSNVEKEKSINNVDEWLDATLKVKKAQSEVFDLYSDLFTELAKSHINSKVANLTLEDEALRLIMVYRQYCNEISKKDDSLDRIFSNINIANRWFQALKLSGALAMIDNRYDIRESDIVKSINITEMINEDIFLFEQELNKSEYEILVEYCEKQQENKIDISSHTLIKANLISKKTLKNDLSNLTILANSKDKDGMYRISDNDEGINYTRFIESKDFGISYLQIPNSSKDDKVKYLNKPLSYARVPFERLANMLKGDFIYSPYQFKDGKRNLENLINMTNLIVFDIDETDDTIEECHNNLCDINHIIASTSDKTNPYKYRIIIPFDKEVEIENKIYKQLCKDIAIDYLPSVKIDLLSQSQIYYAYKDSIVYITNDAINLPIKDYLVNIEQNKSLDALTPKQKSDMLKDSYNTFYFAYNTPEGKRHHNMIKAVAKAYNLGCNYEYVIKLINDINDSFYDKLDEKNIEGIVKFANKLFQVKGTI